MPLRYLVGPADRSFGQQKLRASREAKRCRTFHLANEGDISFPPTATWQDVVSDDEGGKPDFCVLSLAYTTVPVSFSRAPVPLVGLAGDWNLLWHYYRRRLRTCELVLTD